MAPLMFVATAALLLIGTASAQTVTVNSATPNAVTAGSQTATINGVITYSGGNAPPTTATAVTCETTACIAPSPPLTANDNINCVIGTGSTSGTQTNPAVFNVTIPTTYINNGVSTPLDPKTVELFCQLANGASSGRNTANLAINPATSANSAYFISATPDRTTITSQAGTASTVTFSGAYTKGNSPGGIICSRVGPPGAVGAGPPVIAEAPTPTYTGTGLTSAGAFTSATAISAPTNYTAAFDFSGVTPGVYTIRCRIGTGTSPYTYQYGATAYSITVMPPQITRFGNLFAQPLTFQQQTSGNGPIGGWVISGSVQFADNTTTPREIFCASSESSPLLIGQGATTSLSTATRSDVDFTVTVGDISGVSTVDGDPTTAQCSYSATTGLVCPFYIGNATPRPNSGAPYTTQINDYGIQCFSGKIVTNPTSAGGNGHAIVDTTALASFRTNPTAVSSPTVDVALTKPLSPSSTPNDDNFVATSTTTAPTVSTTNTTAGSPITLTGITQGVTASSPRTVLCKTSTSDPSQFQVTTPVVVATGNQQTYSAALPIPTNATSGLYTFRCLLNLPATGAPPGQPFTAVTDQSVNVTIAGIPVTPTSSPTAPTPTVPTVPTVRPTSGPTAPTPPTRSPNPTPFPTRTQGPVPASCSKSGEYRAPGGCERCVSSDSPFKQVFGGSVCVNPTTFSSKSTSCSTYTLQAFPREDDTNDKAAKCISQKSQTISILVVATEQSEIPFLSSASYRKTSLRLGTLRARSNRGLVVWVKKGGRQLVQFDDRYRTVRSQKGKTVKLTGTLRPYVGATLLRCFTSYIKVCND